MSRTFSGNNGRWVGLAEHDILPFPVINLHIGSCAITHRERERAIILILGREVVAGSIGSHNIVNLTINARII